MERRTDGRPPQGAAWPGYAGGKPESPDAPPAPPGEVLVLAPTGRDAELIVRALAAAAVRARQVATVRELIGVVSEEVDRDAPPELGAVVATDDALGVDWAHRLADVLDRQPSWSDLPIVLLARPGATAGEPRSLAAVAERLTGRGSVTVLDRPVRMATLVSAVRAALRARARQAEVRDLIESRDRALAEAERASRVKSEFLAAMSHELRTPLNAIAGYVDLLLLEVHGPLTAEQRADLGRVLHNQHHLLGLINDVLNLSRIESGRVEYEITAFPAADLVAEVMPMIEPQLSAKGLVLETRMPESRLAVAADREKLEQILLNLLSNAVKFTPEGGTITVGIDSDDAASDGSPPVLIRVSDTGIGIPPDKCESIFEPFVQVRSDGSKHEGTGLGLAISRDLARGMGGDLTVQSELGRGSTFTISLPSAGGEGGSGGRGRAADGRSSDNEPPTPSAMSR